MNPKKHLSFGSLRHGLSTLFNKLPDKRQNGKIDYSIHDAMMSGFACMYFQDPSLLQFQKKLHEANNRNNLQTLFGVKNIPESTQLRDIGDAISSEIFRPIFKDYFSRLQRGKHLVSYQFMPGLYLCSIDATQYFYSEDISCPRCLTTMHKDGEISYSHKVLQAAIMHPSVRQVIPLMPEEICNDDGSIKQDCEIKAAKRFIPKIKKDHPQLGLVILGDGLYSDQPFIQEILDLGYHYIFVVKPGDHRYLMEWIEAFDKSEIDELRMIEETGVRKKKRRMHIYEWVNGVPLNGGEDTIKVNFFRYQIIDGKGKIAYKNSWVTDLEITRDNIEMMVRGARCRWKIESAPQAHST